jgi:hypothetical protein
LAKPVIEPLPPEIMTCYRCVTLAADVMYVNGIPILVTVTRNIRFATVEVLPNRNIKTLVNAIKNMLTVYRLNRMHATKLPMPDDVIELVHGIACRQKANPGLVFLDRNQVPDVAEDDADTDDDDSEYVPDEADEYSLSDAGNDDSDYDSNGDDSDYHPAPDHHGADDTDDFDYASDDGSDDDDDGTTGVDNAEIAETEVAEEGGAPKQNNSMIRNN